MFAWVWCVPTRYTIVNTAPFALVGTTVVTTGPLDFESTRTLALTVQSTDDSGASVGS